MRRHSARSCCSLTTNLQSTSPCLPEIMSSELANVHVLGAAAVASAVAASAAGHHPGEVNTQAVQSHLQKTHTLTLVHATRLHAHTSNQYAVPSKRSHPIRGPIQEAASLPTRKHTSQDHVYRNDGWLIVVSVCFGLMHSSGHLNRCTCYNIIQCLDFKRTSARTEPLEHGVGNRTPLCNISDMKYQRHATTLQMQMCTICQPTTHPIQQPTSQPHLHPSF